MKPFSLSIHLFRRDLRLDDNTALIAALSQSEKVMPVFIFDERQLTDNPYKGNNSFEFMLNSLTELDEALKQKGSQLYCFKGIAHEILIRIFSSMIVDALFVNRDYTPFSKKRDEGIAEICQNHKVQFSSYSDALLTEPEQVHKDNGTPYTVFTPFMKKARLLTVSTAVSIMLTNYFSGPFNLAGKITPLQLQENSNPNLMIKGGRREGLILLENLKQLGNYNRQRDFPSIKGTSLLSAHHKFGTISIRETYQQITSTFGKEHTLINELYWRDFFTHIIFHFPHVLGNAFREKYNRIEWENDTNKFEQWCKGSTGFPIVDAGMRELTTTGFMHNRVRMIVASFLTKDLHIDWRWGERFFALHLVDYDPAINNGNWQWASSTGCDAQPYFRIFNPWSQQLKFDPDCQYIKKWIHELKSLSPREIHDLEKNPNLFVSYPRPMVNHKERAEKIKLIFKSF